MAFETFDNIGDQAGHKVDGSIRQPLFVAGTKVISTPTNGDIYGIGDDIRVELTFSEAVNVSGNVNVGLYVGLSGGNYAVAWRAARYNSGSGTNKLVFRYIIKRADVDSDGFNIASGSANTGFGGAGDIRALSDNTKVSRVYRGLAAGPSHKVDGRPRATDVKISSTPTHNDTYQKGEAIEVEMTFSEMMTVDPGGTFIVLRMQSGSTALGPPGGGAWRGAHYNRGSGTNKLVFRYTAKKGDLDDDGVVVVNGDANYGFGGSGTIRAVSDNAKRSPHYSGVVGQKVDARPRVIDIEVVSTPTAGDTYLKDEHIDVEMTFNEAVTVDEGVRIGLYVGLTGNNYAAAWRGAGYNRGSGTNKLVFRYTVKRADLDRDGFSVVRGSATTGFVGSGIRAVSDNAERSPHYSAHYSGSGHRVDGRPYVTGVAVVSTPTMGDTYGRGELFSVALTFSEKVVVKRDAGVDLMLRMESDSASLVADINDSANRFADYVRGSGTDTLVFSYQIEQADTDNDGLVVSRGESVYYVYSDSGIFAEADDAVAVNRSHPGLAAGSSHKADGSARAVFATPDIRIISEPAEGGVYGRGEEIEVRMGFSEAVEVSGDVWISLLLDDSSFQQLRYARGSGTDALVFAYTVQSYDRAADGVTVERGVENRGFGGSGTIRSVNDPADAANYNRTREFEIKVDGSLHRPLRVTGVSVISSPASGGVYGRGETIEVEVTFSAPVRTAKYWPDLSLALQIGAKRRLAHFVSGYGTNTLVFAYRVLQSERDADGVVVVANSLTGDPICTIVNYRIGPVTLYEPHRDADGNKVPIYVTDENGNRVPKKIEATNCRNNPEHPDFTDAYPGDIVSVIAGKNGITFGYPMDAANFNLDNFFNDPGYFGVKYDGKYYPNQQAALDAHTFANGKRVIISDEIKYIVRALINNPDPSDDDDLKARLRNLDYTEVYYSPSVEASLGHTSFAAGPDHKVDGWQHIRPTDLSGVELPIPQDLSFVIYSDKVELAWDAVEDVGDRVTGYRIFRKGPGDSALQSYADVSGKDTKIYADTNIEPDTTYEYAVAALGADSSQGERSASATVTTQPQLPPLDGQQVILDDDLPQPQNLSFLVYSDRVELSWDAIDEEQVTGYRVLRKGPDDAELQTLADLTGNDAAAHVDRGVEPGSTYEYAVAALDADSFPGEPSASVTATTPPPLTAEFLEAPESHDGESSFTFELRFSEEFGLSYKTLRDHAFEATGGRVAGARRLEPGSNVRWEIAVEPSGKGDVTVVLPVTGDCESDGAVCTDDGRPLSNRLELTVSGPVEQQENNPATGAPTITGTAQVGETLTAGTSGIADPDGLTNASFSYQWLAADTDISSATGASYTLSAADEGKTVKVRVSFTDDAGNGESLTSAATDAVAEAPSQTELSLSDFNREGLETEVLALFVAGDEGGEPALYNASSRWDASGSLLEGDVGIGPDEVALQRVMYLPDGGALRFNDADALSLKDYFGAGGAGNDLTVWVQTAGGSVSFAASDVDSAGGNYVNFNLPPDAKALIAGIGAGERFILALTRPTPIPTPSPTPSPTPTPAPEPPARPQGLTIGSYTHDAVTLTWTDPGDASISGYQILRRVQGPGAGFAPIAEDTGSAATTYVDASVVAETRYTYRVKARNSAGLSEQSSYANVDVPAIPAPAAPQGLTAGSVTHESVPLTWDDPDDDSITGYQVLRRVRADGTDFAVIEDDTGKADTEFTDATVEPETDYAYRVKARNSAGLSPASSDANADVPAAPAQAQQNPTLNLFAAQLRAIDADGTLISQTVELSWEDPDDDAITSYRILRKVVNAGTDFAVIKADTGTTGLWYSDATVEPGTRYAYRVQAIIPDGFSSPFNDVEVETDALPPPPEPTPTPTPTPEPLTPLAMRVITDDGPFSRDSDKEFNTLQAAGNTAPIDIWGDSRTMYTTDANNVSSVFAYNRSDMAHNSDRSFNLHNDNSSPSGLWSDGRTMWVVDYSDKILYAYRLSNGARDSSKDLTLGTSSPIPTGIWGNRDTLWVATHNQTPNSVGKILAFNRSTKLRDSDKDITTHRMGQQPSGIWSDGTTLWAVLGTDEAIYAYDLATGVREEALDFTLSTEDLDRAWGIWSDGETMWVSDSYYEKIFAYRMPTNYQARLEDLAVYPYNIVGGTNDLGDFHWTTEEYVLNVTGEKAEVTLDWTPKDPNARVRASRSDTDRGRVGHQMALRYGSNEITFRVTAPGNIRKTYTLTVNRASDAAMGWNPVLEDGAPTGGYADTCTTGLAKWQVNGDNIEAYSRSTDERDSVLDFTAAARAAGNRDVVGIACGIHTMWVQDGDDGKVYAYNMPAYANAPQRVTATATQGRVSLRWTAPNLAHGEVTGYEVWRYDGAWSDWQTIKKLASLNAVSEYGNPSYPDLSIPASRVRQFEYGDHDGDGVDSWLHDHDGDDANNNGCKDSVNNDVCAPAQDDSLSLTPEVGEPSTPRQYVWPTPYEWLYDHDNNRGTPLRIVPPGTDLSAGYYMHDHDNDKNTDMDLLVVYPHHVYTDNTAMAGGVEYVYLVYARYQYGRSSGAHVNVIAASNTISRPSAPENLAKTVTSNSATLRWDAPADGTATGYRIERYIIGEYTDDGSNKRKVLTARQSGRSYTDRAIDPAKGYIWEVYSVNRHGILSAEERSVSVYIGSFPDP